MATIPTMKVKKKKIDPSLASPILIVLLNVASRTIPSSGKTTEQIPVINAPVNNSLPTAAVVVAPYPEGPGGGGYPPPIGGGCHCWLS
jgi:hypothetical protein